ncbi:uncharacterized protein LOC115632232 isoform X2 [Scaptodrosophila lebanonensis]|uniref:Uncharacterized protein LOC115632232 isoform X2 n=1 Tax=Drosophila lebanonensis TaxID=7225 RepID=A0A6J2UDF7_DROLE|nr:uncharacterized protein LOC115632232 isoform X2 [Scaptodrosophila lebanonensis]
MAEGARSVKEIQQDFAESLGHGDEVIWDLLSQTMADLLQKKIRELIPDPRESDDKKKRAAENARNSIFTAVWEQRKYTNRQSLTSIIYVLVVPEETGVANAENSVEWSCHPLFRARRCISDEVGVDSSSSNCCMIFVDENGRVYQNWQSYVEDNELPPGVMVAPENGVYNIREGSVKLVKYVTPAGTPKYKALKVADTASAIGAFGSALLTGVAIFAMPIAAPVMAVGAGVGLASAGYATARSAGQLIDRGQHEQSINVTDRAARGHWIGVVAGAVGLGAAGATSAMTAATRAGREVGTIAQMTINGMNISSIVISGTGVANGILELILKSQDGDDVSTMDVLQLSASLVLFTHSVYNFRLASTIISETQNSTISSYRKTLSNRQRRSFDKIAKETQRLRGPTQGKMDIIRNVNEVPSKQQFNDMFKINKQLNERGVRPAFASDGTGIVLNDQVKVTNTQDFRANVQHNVGPDILGQVTEPIPRGYEGAGRTGSGYARVLFRNPTSLETPETTNMDAAVRALRDCSISFACGIALNLKEYGDVIFTNILNAESFENLIGNMVERFAPEVFDLIMKLTRTFMESIRDDLHSVLKIFISTETVLFKMLEYILTIYEEITYELIKSKFDSILRAVKDHFLSLNPNNYNGLLIKCDKCMGFYNICKL